MDGELATALIAVSTTVAGVLGYIGKEMKMRYEERKIEQRASETPAPTMNGKYVTRESLKDHCEGQLAIIAGKFDAVEHKQDAHSQDLRDLTRSIYQWKDDAVEKLADHGARLGSLERHAHGTRG